MRAGFLFIISSPSGGGKSTILRELLRRDPSLYYSISCTTRPPRAGEEDGRHYFFLPVSEFRRRIRRGELLEWALVHGNYYGTPKRFIDEKTAAGRVVLLDIDVQGAAKIRRRRADAVSLFLRPPSLKELEARLRRRRDTRGSIGTRLKNARRELARAGEYDYCVVNDRLKPAVAQAEAIVLAELLRVGRRSGKI
ncbi:MAG: guanylate kinase [Elusimicrobia bacterium GWA2_69_24]|nr:MAG: guanylate kinase [Elusimicrobia bacterium GWA2_69_24]HBL18795.1 guanylate kinase [Elusimicrobiota bacterium]